MALYVPGTEETDPKKIIMSQQLVAGQTTTNTTSIATNTANIATNTTNIATNTAAIAALNAATYVNSINSRTGAITLNSTSGITNNSNDIILSQASSAQFGAVKVDNTTITAAAGVISAAGTRVLLNTLTASSSASLADTTSLTSTYYNYEIVFENVLPATNSVIGRFRVNSGGVQSTSYAVQQTIFQGGTVSASAITTEVRCTSSAGNANTGPGLSGDLRISNPSGTTARKSWWGTLSYNTTASAAATNLVSGYWDGGNGAITGFEFTFSSGNIASGTIKVYGWN
jgi:hypothetical protein